MAEALAPKVTIAGEEYSTALTQLNLSGSDVTDADLLSLGEMTNLEELTLPCSSAISDITPVAGLTNLKRLSFTGDWGSSSPVSNITDFSPIAGLTGLTRLDLVVSSSTDLSFLSGLTELTILRLMGNVTTDDLGALRGLTKLQELRVSGNGLKSAAGIEGMTEMRNLRIDDSAGTFYMEDLSPLSGMTKLETLRLDANGLKSFRGMENLTNLRQAEFYGDNSTYTDVDPLKNLTKLEVLRLPMHSRGVRFNADGLSGLTNLQALSVRVRPANDLVDLSPLSGLTQLNTLYIATDQNDHVTASNLGALSGLTNLSSLELHVNNLTDIELHPKSWTRKSTKGVQKSMGKELFSEELKLAVVQYVLEGHTRKEASEKFCVSCTPIEKWVNLYKLHGAKGLLSRNLVGRQKGFDGEFRLKVLQYKQEHHLSCTQTAMHFCLDVVTVCRWEKKFQKEGARGLMKKQATKGSEKRQKKQEQSELQQENKRLSEENYRLRMENDYLKKLNALIQKREKPE